MATDSHETVASGSTATEANNHQFNFPFQPYDIQLKLMDEAYQAYEGKQFALLESPTGTGKSLSLLCSALTWLRDHRDKEEGKLVASRTELLDKVDALKRQEEESNDWLAIQTQRQDFTKEITKIDKQLERINKFRQRARARRHAKLHGIPLDSYAAFIDKSSAGEMGEKELDLNTSICSQTSTKSDTNATDEVDEVEINKKLNQQEQDYLKPKIFFASRTHSQLGQFIGELKKTKFSNSTEEPPVGVVALASRANLCVNPEVVKLRDPNAINERCMEMQKETNSNKRCSYMKAKQVNMLKEDILSSVQDIEDLVSRGRTLGSCPYYATRVAIPEAELVVLPYNNLLHRETRQSSSLDLQDNIVIVDEAHNILETICSIHSAPITGQQLIGSHTIFSRYYAKYHSRMTPRNAAVVKIVVQCLTALIKYLNNPRQHLRNYECPKSVNLEEEEEKRENNQNHSNGENKAGLRLNANGKLSKPSPTYKHEELMIDTTKFIGAANVERFNVFKILDYFNRSQLARKMIGFFRQDNSIDLSTELHGFELKSNQLKDSDLQSPMRKRKKVAANKRQATGDQKEASIPPARDWELTSLNFLKSQPNLVKKNLTIASYPVYALVEFLRSLTNVADDGKILTDYHEGDIFKSSLKFILLNPSSQFQQMTQQARSIILAGGTMQPFGEYIDLLFMPLGIARDRIKMFSCGHVIARDQLYVASLTNGVTGKPLELSYKTKSALGTIDEIGATVMEIALKAPGGLVCFFPSYEYEQICFTRWTQVGFISKIETRAKRVFREPKQANHMKTILDEYTKAVLNGKDMGRGAMLLSVVGGKMSEGINFNDDLGRCVVMIGLPYANIKSGELQQKMSYYDRTCTSSAGDSAQGQKVSAGQQYYENLCIRGINQSIGRAIRHQKDYASIILLDRRYCSKASIKQGLPGWMRESMEEYEQFDPMLSRMRDFFTQIEERQ